MRGGAGLFVVVAALVAGVAACGGDDGAVRSNETVGGSPASSSPSQRSTSVPHDEAGDESGLPLRFGAVTERSVDGGADGRNTTAAIAGMNDFAIDLYRTVAAEQDGNTIVGPYSVTFALGMIYAGARGETAREMAETLRVGDLKPADWHEGINAYDLTLDARTAGGPTEWTAANKVWVQPGLALRDEYLDVLTGAYGSPLAEADFGTDPEGVRELVNEWVEDRTDELIPELFPLDSFDAQTRMVLVNAVGLDAPWEFPFDPAMTRDEPFTRADGTTVRVPMMHYDEFLPSLWRKDVQAVELPYGGGALSMVVIVPTDLEVFESKMTSKSLTTLIDAIDDGGIHLSLPKWTARTHVQLNDTLAELGMPTAFSGGADFSGMVDGGGLWISKVEHEAVIEVDEQGTRAAAATGGVMEGSHGPTIAVNRPFLYVIRDRGAGTILFIGRVADPTARP